VIAPWVSLLRWVVRRPAAGPGDQAFSHVGGVALLMWGFVIMGVVETGVLHLILPWDRVRLVTDVVSVLGLLFVLGLRADLVMHPHLVTPTALVVRQTTAVRIELPWTEVTAVTATKERPGNADGVPVNSLTNMEAVAGDRVLRFWADDPKSLAAAALARTSPQAAPRP
jgi:hypothetical protein